MAHHVNDGTNKNYLIQWNAKLVIKTSLGRLPNAHRIDLVSFALNIIQRMTAASVCIAIRKRDLNECVDVWPSIMCTWTSRILSAAKHITNCMTYLVRWSFLNQHVAIRIEQENAEGAMQLNAPIFIDTMAITFAWLPNSSIIFID